MKSKKCLTAVALIAAMTAGYAGIASAQDGKDATIKPRGSNATAPANTPESDVGAGAVNPMDSKSGTSGTQSNANSGMQSNTKMSTTTLPPNAVIGMPVMNRAGDKIGTVDGIVRDRGTMESYALIDVGDFLSVKDRKILVPLDTLRISFDNSIMMSQGDDMGDLKKAAPFNHAAGNYDVRIGDATRPQTELNYGAKPEVDSGAKPDHTDDGSAPK